MSTAPPKPRNGELGDLVDVDAMCPSCGGLGLMIFYEQEAVPIHSCRLVATKREAARFPRGSLRLGFCGACGFITNMAYDPSVQDYAVSYEETQGFSPRFQAFMRELAAELVAKYALRGKELLEIGCGKGEFLVLMCELGPNTGIGIDPSFVEERIESEAADRITFINDLYSERYAHLAADLVICRHTLEHIHPVSELLQLLRRSLEGRPESVVFFELPDMMRILRDIAFWDIYYEHCSYFTCGSLARLFRRSGFEVIDLSLVYDGQYILLDGRPARGAPEARFALEETPEELWEAVRSFQGRIAEVRRHWGSLLRDARRDGRRVVVWGSGSKGVAFLTTVGVEDEVEYVVDINPYKHGMFMPVTAQEIVPPAFLAEYEPDLVIAMNSIYLPEIQQELDRLCVKTELVGV